MLGLNLWIANVAMWEVGLLLASPIQRNSTVEALDLGDKREPLQMLDWL